MILLHQLDRNEGSFFDFGQKKQRNTWQILHCININDNVCRNKISAEVILL